MNVKSIGLALVLAGAPLLAACSLGGSSPPGGSTATGPIIVGELMPVSGKEAFVGTWFDTGADAGIYAVNQAGGVMGRQLQFVLNDTGGDPVDAVPALHALLLSSPSFVVGPSSLEILGVIKDFGADKLPDLMQGGTTALDTMNYPYVFRLNSSDSQLLAGEAYYALNSLHCTNASLMYEDSSNGQDEVPPLVKAFTGNGGTILENLKLEPGASSYSSEVATAFSKHPQCVFFHATPAEASTLFANVKEQGDLNVHFITGDTGASIDLANAMGLSEASKWMTGTTGPTVDADAVAAFTAAFTGRYPGQKPLNANASEGMYDAVVIAALAMSEAKTTDGSVWVNDIEKVSNPPGTACYTYPTCLALIQQGTKINYEGAATDDNFNQYHNVFSPESIVQFPASGGTPQPILTISEAQLSAMYKS